MGNKVTLSWKNAPAVCFFCECTGHFRKDCESLKEARRGRETLDELRKTPSPPPIPPLPTSSPLPEPTMEKMETNTEQQITEDKENNPFLDTPREETQSVSLDDEERLFEETIMESDNKLQTTQMDTSTAVPSDFERTPSPSQQIAGNKHLRSKEDPTPEWKQPRRSCGKKHRGHNYNLRNGGGSSHTSK